jgi:hypothetical protein
VNWDQIAGTWKEVSGKARARWGKITDDEWTQPAVFPALMWAVRGNVRTRYGYARVLNRHSGRRRAHRTIRFAAQGSLILFLLGFSGFFWDSLADPGVTPPRDAKCTPWLNVLFNRRRILRRHLFYRQKPEDQCSVLLTQDRLPDFVAPGLRRACARRHQFVA